MNVERFEQIRIWVGNLNTVGEPQLRSEFCQNGITKDKACGPSPRWGTNQYPGASSSSSLMYFRGRSDFAKLSLIQFCIFHINKIYKILNNKCYCIALEWHYPTPPFLYVVYVQCIDGVTYKYL